MKKIFLFIALVIFVSMPVAVTFSSDCDPYTIMKEFKHKKTGKLLEPSMKRWPKAIVKVARRAHSYIYYHDNNSFGTSLGEAAQKVADEMIMHGRVGVPVDAFLRMGLIGETQAEFLKDNGQDTKSQDKLLERWRWLSANRPLILKALYSYYGIKFIDKRKRKYHPADLDGNGKICNEEYYLYHNTILRRRYFMRTSESFRRRCKERFGRVWVPIDPDMLTYYPEKNRGKPTLKDIENFKTKLRRMQFRKEGKTIVENHKFLEKSKNFRYK